MIKKILITLLLFSSLMMLSVNAVTYLNECGKNSGWVENEIYIINFTQVDEIYNNAYCFQVTNTNLDNITFQGNGQEIDIKSNTLIYFMDYISNNQILTPNNWTFENLNIKISSSNNVKFLFGNINFVSGTPSVYFNDFNLLDLNLNNFQNVLEVESAGWFARVQNTYINNSYFDLTNALIQLNADGNTGHKITNNYVENTILISPYDLKGIGVENLDLSNNIFNHSTLIITTQLSNDDRGYLNQVTNNYYDNSLIFDKKHVDVNNNNLADTNIYTRITNAKISQDLQGYRFLQDTTEGFPFMVGTDKTFMVINYDNLSFASAYYDLQNTNNNNVLVYEDTIQLHSISSMQLSPNSELTNFIDKSAIIETDIVGSTGQNEKGRIKLSNNNQIQDITFNLNNILNDQTSLMSNYLFSSRIQNPTINNNEFNINGNYNNSRETIFEFVSTNLEVYNNTFENSNHINNYFDVSDNGEVNLYYNNFTRLDSNNPYIFKTNSLNTAYIYLNWFDSQTHNIGNPIYTNNIALNKSVSYVYNNNVYIFNLGNYWEGYSNSCDDLNNDGICDDSLSIQNGTYTDHKPLSSYPFDFQSNLLNADQVIPLSAFEVSYTYPSNNSVFNLDSSSDPISFVFEHDSLSLLDCSYYFQDVLTYSVNNVAGNTPQNYSFTGWSTGQYWTYVICSNEYVSNTSNVIIFNVSVSGDEGNGVNPPTSENDFESSDGIGLNGVDDLSLTGLFSDDISESTDNVQGLFSLFETPLGILAVIGIVLLAFSILFLLFAFIMGVIG